MLPETRETFQSKFLFSQVAERVGDVRPSLIGLVDVASDVAGDIGFPDHLLKVLAEFVAARVEEQPALAFVEQSIAFTAFTLSFTAGCEDGTCSEYRILISRAKHCRTISQSEAPTCDLALPAGSP